MGNYDDFTRAERAALALFFNECQKVINWKEYGPAEWYLMFDPTVVGDNARPVILKAKVQERKTIRMMVKLGMLVPEIEDDKEYKVQRALGIVTGRIYYMPEKIRKELKDEAIDL